ncbi:MAG: hypothetical protein ACKO04_13690 [Actinomycetes bacterium]
MSFTSPTSPSRPSRSSARPAHDDYAAWQRWVCLVGTSLIVTGDLHPERSAALAQLERWLDAGAVGIIDCRGEWTDEDLVAVAAPQLDYRYLGTDDAGQGQDDEWFEAGLAHYLDLVQGGGRVVVHCHMGINRGPSMAFALLLATGWGITAALDTVAEARPIVGLIYATDAVRWWGRRNGWTEDQVNEGIAEVSLWHLTKGIDIAQVIRVIRQATRKELG